MSPEEALFFRRLPTNRASACRSGNKICVFKYASQEWGGTKRLPFGFLIILLVCCFWSLLLISKFTKMVGGYGYLHIYNLWRSYFFNICMRGMKWPQVNWIPIHNDVHSALFRVFSWHKNPWNLLKMSSHKIFWTDSGDFFLGLCQAHGGSTSGSGQWSRILWMDPSKGMSCCWWMLMEALSHPFGQIKHRK